MGDMRSPSPSLDESVVVVVFSARSLAILFVISFVHVLIHLQWNIPLRRRSHSPPIVCTAPQSFNDTERYAFATTSFSLPSRGDPGDGSTRCSRMLFVPRSVWSSSWVPSHVDWPALFSFYRHLFRLTLAPTHRPRRVSRAPSLFPLPYGLICSLCCFSFVFLFLSYWLPASRLCVAQFGLFVFPLRSGNEGCFHFAVKSLFGFVGPL